MSSVIEQTAPAQGLELYRELHERGFASLRAGDLEAALEHFDAAQSEADALGDRELVELSECNHAAILIELGRSAGQLARMQAILLASRNACNCMVAATNAARLHDLAKDYKKALFYGRLAHNHACAAGDDSQRASVRNLIANQLLALSRVDEAAHEYSAALELMPRADPIWRARLIGNLGYCRVLQQRLRDAFELLHESVELLRREGAERYLVSPLLDLAFAHLESGHPDDARAAADEALRLAREFEDEESVKNGLYLAGEAAGLCGDVEAARRCFGELQTRYYPDLPFVSEFLLSVDVRKVVNLRA